jgi:hypothetical protein
MSTGISSTGIRAAAGTTSTLMPAAFLATATLLTTTSCLSK